MSRARPPQQAAALAFVRNDLELLVEAFGSAVGGSVEREQALVRRIPQAREPREARRAPREPELRAGDLEDKCGERLGLEVSARVAEAFADVVEKCRRHVSG